MRLTSFLPKINKLKESRFLTLIFKNFYLLNLGLIFLVLFLFAFIVKPKDEVKIAKAGQIASINFRALLPAPALYPINKNISPPPELTVDYFLIVDADSAATLYEKNSDLRVPPASTTKIMTALIALEQYPLDKILVVGAQKIDGNILKLVPGENITVENLLYGLLVASGNDAALVLAENFPGGIANFIEAMNKKATDLNLNNTHFTNPIGLDEVDHYSTAKDLAKLTMVAIKNSVFSKIVSTPEFVMKDTTGTKTHFFKNTNELVGKMSEIKGVKTGWTQNAGECLITLVEKNNRKIILVMLGSKDRFGETQKMIDWVFENFKWETISP